MIFGTTRRFNMGGGGVGKALGTVAGGVGGAILGGPMGAMAGMSLGGGVGGMLDGPAKDPMADAYKSQANASVAQAQAAVQSAQIQAGAARHQANTQLAIAAKQAQASMQAANTSAMGGIIGAALGAHTTTEQIKQWTPTEAGAQTIQSWDLAQRWNKTLSMRTAGYQDVAINYELGNKHYSSLFSDPQWNALKMIDMTRQDVVSAVQQFGIRSTSNPTGIQMDERDWIELQTYKKPDEMLSVDPNVAAQRNAQFSAWEKSMRDQGMGLVVDLYKNPQLAGSSILTMKGKDAMIDPSMAGLMGAMMNQPTSGGSAEYDAFARDPARNKYRISSKDGKQVYVDANGNEVSKAVYDQWRSAEQAERDRMTSIAQSDMTKERRTQAQQKGMWDKAIDALTKGEQNEYSEQIKQLQEAGVIDKYGMINAGALSSYIPPELMEGPQFSPFREISPEQEAAYKDQFKALTEIQVDPKMVRSETLGNGITRLTKLNADGSVATQALSGYMMDMTGQQHYVAMNGRGLQDWNDRQMMVSGNPFRPGMRAAANVDNYMSDVFGIGGTMSPKQPTGQPNQGNKGQTAPKSPSTSNIYGSDPLKAPSAPKPISGSSGGSQSTPAGYSGASLSAGGD